MNLPVRVLLADAHSIVLNGLRALSALRILFLLRGGRFPAVWLATVFFWGQAAAADVGPAANELRSLSLEQLLNVEVISVSKKYEQSLDAAAAMYVITQDDIRRSGINRIPEALRLAPGVEVAQIDAALNFSESRDAFDMGFVADQQIASRHELNLWMDVSTDPGSLDTTSVATLEGASPRRETLLRSSLEFGQYDFDLTVRTEYGVKAAFLANYAGYVEWPQTVRVDAETAFIVCVLGHDPFGETLDSAFQYKSIQGRPVILKRIQNVADATDCRMIFIRLSDPAKLPSVLQALRGMPVLTVADTADFAREGVMINMRREGNRVRFDINLDAAESAGLKLSSQLLKLATQIHRRKAPGS